jgi:two-component system, OmpR family, response regulator MprA
MDASATRFGRAPRILVIEDDWRIGAFLDRALRHRGYDVQVVREGSTALKLSASGVEPDLVILDLMLPDISGFEVAKQLRSRSSVPILVLTARDAVADRVRGLDLGADDYLIKPFALEELLARVRAALRRVANADATARRGRIIYGDVIIDQDTHEALVGEQRLELRNREYDLLAYFVRNPERVLSRHELREEVWGDDFPGDSNVIEVTVGSLRRKLEAGGAADVIRTVRAIGYMLRQPPNRDGG